MARNILIDLNILLDYYETGRRARYPESVMAFDYLKHKDFAFVAASTIENFEFLKYSYISREYPNKSRKQKLKIVRNFVKEILSYFKIAKTPSYVTVDSDDIGDALLIASSRAIDGLILTRDKKLLEKYPEMTIHPRDFLKRIENEQHNHIPLLDLTRETFSIYPEIEEGIDRVISRSNFILGKEVQELEENIAHYIGTKHAVGVSSGTDALLLSLRALALKRKGEEFWDKDDLIITTPFTFTATGDTILRAGATPCFVDIDPETLNIDPAQIREALAFFASRNKKVVGIVPVHLFGLPCDMGAIMEIARTYGLFVVEDVAQGFGGSFKGKRLGSIGDTGCFSFFPTKNLGCFGDGGMITTNDDTLAELVRALRVHGGRDKYNVDHIGYKARLDTLQAAVLLAKLRHVDRWNALRQNIARKYDEGLSGLQDLRLPPSPDALLPSCVEHVYHQYTVRVKSGKRDALREYLKSQGVEAMVYYPVPLHKMKVFQGRCEIFGELQEAEKAAQEVLSLPIEPLMDEEEINRVIAVVQEGMERIGS